MSLDMPAFHPVSGALAAAILATVCRVIDGVETGCSNEEEFSWVSPLQPASDAATDSGGSSDAGDSGCAPGGSDGGC